MTVPRPLQPNLWPPRIARCFLAIFFIVLTSCGDPSEPSASKPVNVAQEVSPSTDEAATPIEPSQNAINRQLSEIRKQDQVSNPFYGEANIRTLRKRLKDPDIRSNPGLTLQTLMLLGIEEVDFGNLDAGIARLKEAHELVGLLDAPNTVRAQIIASLGMAYFRLAENDNCCARYAPESCIVPLQGKAIHTVRQGSEQAIHYFAQALKLKEVDPYLRMKCVWLTNLAYMTLGDYPHKVPKGLGIPPSAFQSPIAFPKFKNIAHGLGVDHSNLAGGAIMDDFDGDDDLDLVTSSWDTSEFMNYHENKGDGTFQERSESAGLNNMMGGLNIVQADYDGDGDLDILVLRGAWMGELGRHPNSLLQNQGNGTFIDRTHEAGLGKVHYPTQTAAWADYDNDGDLDVFIGNETDGRIAAPSQLFQNQGDGTFIDVAQDAGVTNDRYTKGVVWGDIDGDRYPDLIVSNLFGENRLYHNLGDGTFEDIASAAGIDKPIRSFPLWTWDFNNDGNLDIFISAYSARVGDFVLHYLGHPTKVEPSGHFQGDGRGAFTNVARADGLDQPMLTMGSNYGDLNNDGYLDFYLGTGEPDISVILPNMMFLNRGGEHFIDVTMAGGFAHLQKGHSVAFADFDEDGDQDIFEQMGGAKRVDKYRDSMYENPGFGNHWLKVKLIGTVSNRSGIGARIHAKFVEKGEPSRSVYRHISSGGSFGANPLREHIGLGKATTVLRLEIYWPTSNQRQIFKNVAANQFIEVTEGEPQFRVIARSTIPESDY